MERAMITGASVLVLISVSSIIQDIKGFSGVLNAPQNVTDKISVENSIVTLVGGFLIMRVFKTAANSLLSSRNPKIVKVLGNMFLGGTVLAGSGGALLSSAHQTTTEFSTFHWQVAAIFALEFVGWETFSCVSQMVYCAIIIKAKLGNFAKFFANPIVLYYLDGHGLKK